VYSDIIRRAQIENYFTICATVAIVLGLYAMGSGSCSLWGMLMMLNINTFGGEDK